MSNQKDKPDWLSAPDPDAILTICEAPTHASARTRSEELVRNEVALRLYSSVSGLPLSNLSSEQAQSIIQKSGLSDFFSSITLNSADNIYWQHIKRKNTLLYVYYVKYPFGQPVRDSLSTRWKAKISEASEVFREIKGKALSEYTSIPSVLNEIGLLDKIIMTLILGDSIDCADRRSSLKQALDNITTEADNAAPTTMRYRLLFSGTPILPAARPSFNGCAKVKSLFNDTTSKWQTIKYDVQNCDPCASTHSLQLKYSYGTWEYTHDLPFNLEEYCVDFSLQGYISNSYSKRKTGFLSSVEDQTINLIVAPQKPGQFKITRIDYSYYQRGLFNVKTITRKFEGINRTIGGMEPVEMSITREVNDQDDKETAGTYEGLVTIHYVNTYTGQKETKQIKQQEIRIIR